jgi:hypothetical protein
MLTNIIKISLLLLFLTLISCVEPFKPDFDAYEKALVVEGIVTDEEGPYRVNLSETAGNYHPRFRPVSEADVVIEDHLGNSATLQEKNPGEYYTNADFRAVSGRRYQLKIELENGEKYASDFSEMKEKLPIDSFYAKPETTEDPITGNAIPGYRFFADIQTEPNTGTYLAWRGTETYEYVSSFTIDYIYDGEVKPFDYPYIYYRCWKTQSVHKTTLFESPVELTQTNISVPLNHTHLSKFNIKYSLLLKQYVIEKETHDYLKKINELNEAQGTFYDTQPFRVYGNIKNVNDPDEYVAGYFYAAAKTEKRIFMSDDSFNMEWCQPDFRGYAFIGMATPATYPIYIVATGGRRAVAPKACFDCRMKGGVTEKPDFWE